MGGMTEAADDTAFRQMFDPTSFQAQKPLSEEQCIS